MARNSAAKISNGAYFALQDVDDEMHSDRMALQFKALEELRKNGEEGTNATNRRNRLILSQNTKTLWSVRRYDVSLKTQQLGNKGLNLSLIAFAES